MPKRAVSGDMSLLTSLAYALHGLAAGTWVGAIVLVTWKVLPSVEDTDLTSETLATVMSGLVVLTRTNSLVMPATGLWMAWDVYDGFSGLLVPPRGHAVLAMIVLWVGLTGLVEVGAARSRRALDQNRVETAARDAGPVLKAASLVGLLLLCLGGYLAAPPI